MLFSSLVFIWYFLPAVFILYFLLPGLRAKNLLLLAASLFFYAWGEPFYVLLMIASIFLNYLFGTGIEDAKGKSSKKLLIALCVLVNLGLLGYFKYFDFFISILNTAVHRQLINPRVIALPIGISFYTFQALSYVADVYRGKIRAQRNLLKLALYISFFPQLIAGPIVKYYEVEKQLTLRCAAAEKIAYGIKRFSYGMAKKIIFANTFAYVVDRVLKNPVELLSSGLIWFSILLYALQIYYDFSGYSDMAIGLGKIFGFDFMENFDYPYLSASIREYWRRWHISLSTWFKEYLYFPLGGNRKGSIRTLLNLFLVFLATGLWHGAGANFLLWGAYHGFFIVIERLFLGKWLEKNSLKFLNHAYALLVVFMGWPLFRMEDLGAAKDILSAMLHFREGYYTVQMFADFRIFFYTGLGILLCGPVQGTVKRLRARLYDEIHTDLWDVAVMGILLFICTVFLVNDTYNPFIYFRF